MILDIIIVNSKTTQEDLVCLGGGFDDRLLKNYGWNKKSNENSTDSFVNFLITNDNTQNVPSEYRFFNRTNSQKKIREIELASPQHPYLATILDLTSNHIDFLKNLRVTTLEHLEKVYEVNLNKDRIEMYFHFPYAESTTTLHLHIRVNQGHHPMESARSFPLDEVIDYLEKGEQISRLILQKNPYYLDDLDILHDTVGVSIEEAKNPHIFSNQDKQVELNI